MSHRQRIESGISLSIEERLHLLSQFVRDALADREGHLRMDSDGAPPLGEVPCDPYRDFVRDTALRSLKEMWWSTPR